MDLVVLKNINKYFGAKQVSKNVNLAIREGEFFTLLGPSGCGKTTLLRLIAGFITPEQGTIFLDGKDITHLPIEKRNVGMVFQNYALFPHLNVYENVAYGLRIKKLSAKMIEKSVKKHLELMNLEGYEKRRVSELSGGEQQRVALARALVIEPQVLLLDEPLSNLDARLRDKMRQELKDIQLRLGVTTIFVTHDQNEAIAISDRIAVFKQGVCVQVGTPNEVYTNPVNTFVASFVGETNLLPRTQFPLELPDSREGNFLSIRPHDIKLNIEPSPTEKSFEGTIITCKPQGAILEYLIAVKQIKLKVIVLNRTEDRTLWQSGQRVYLSINQDAIKVLKE